MGVTVDLIPRLPGEEPEDAIARIYGGGSRMVLDPDSEEVWLEPIDACVEPAPEGAFDDWRAEVLRRLHELYPHWSSEEVNGYPHLWSDAYLWQIEFGPHDITLRSRRWADPDTPGPDDTSLLAVFEGLRTIIHWPHDHGLYADLDDPPQRPDLIG